MVQPVPQRVDPGDDFRILGVPGGRESVSSGSGHTQRSAMDESPLSLEAGLLRDRGNLVVKEVTACVVTTRGGWPNGG